MFKFKNLFSIFFLIFLSFGTLMGQDNVSILQKLYKVKATFPGITKVGILINPDGDDYDAQIKKINIAAASTGLEVVVAEANNLKQLADSYKNLVNQYQVKMVCVVGDSKTLTGKIACDYLIKNTTINKVALLAPVSDWVDAGAFMAIRKVEGKTKLYVNMKAAKAIGITVPAELEESTDFFAAN